MTTAFDPIKLGKVELANRIAMAPMSRSRSYGPEALPSPAAATYYRQRASAGLIISEGIQPSPIARGYPATPGLHTAAQIQAWRSVTDAVHAAGGVIFAQLMHAGRIGHPTLLPAGRAPVGPSEIRADTTVFTPAGPQPCVEPQRLSAADIDATISDYAVAAEHAMAAGFDGVEIHGANGFLIHQFLSDNANLRDDEWGGPVENRIRLGVEVARAVTEAIGADRVGFQISPGNPFNDIRESRCAEVYPALVEALDGLQLAYLNLSESNERELTPRLRGRWSTVFILNPFTPAGPTGPEQLELVATGATDMISYGALFIANPDLPRRLARGGPFAAPDRATFYGGDTRGYTDYPSLDG